LGARIAGQSADAVGSCAASSDRFPRRRAFSWAIKSVVSTDGHTERTSGIWQIGESPAQASM
jgi:hypothetical protein